MKSTDGAGQAKAAQPIDGTNPNASSGTTADPNTKKRKHTRRHAQQDEEDVSSSLPSPSLPYLPKRHRLVEPGKHNANITLERNNPMKSTEASTMQVGAAVTATMTTRRHAPCVRDEHAVMNLVERTLHLMKLVDTLEQSTMPVEDRYHHHDVSMITMTKCFHNPLTSNCDKGQTRLLGMNTFTQRTITMPVYPKKRWIIYSPSYHGIRSTVVQQTGSSSSYCFLCSVAVQSKLFALFYYIGKRQTPPVIPDYDTPPPIPQTST